MPTLQTAIPPYSAIGIAHMYKGDFSYILQNIYMIFISWWVSGFIFNVMTYLLCSNPRV